MVVLCHFCVYKFRKLLYRFKKGSILISIKVQTTSNNALFHPIIITREKIYIYNYIQQMIGVLAARNNLKVKNARQPVALN